MIQLEAEGQLASAYLAEPGQPGPGVLLMHAWWGLNDFFKEMADRLAGEGFVVLAPDLYHGTVVSTIEEAERQIDTLSDAYASAVVRAAADYLLGHSSVEGAKLGAAGFSMGAAFAAWLAKERVDVVAVVLFYGGVEQGEDYPQQTEAAFLGHFASHDEWESDEIMRQLEKRLREGGREAQFYVYPETGHWFFESNRPEVYNADAAQLAWERTVDFLRGKLG